ncbi:MAG: type III-A CRISPR-associated protein Cas10/Csm1 [Nitrospirae bacterium]|nr:type III-A CRISPR-associated protein Cas10/Csm1 [Nitrospirota bacterium]
MLDETIYKVAIAAFMHDIGKFAKRAGFNVSPEFLNNNADLYQPYIKEQNRHTHKHVVYTAAFIDHIEKLLPKQFNKGEWGLGDSFMNLAAGHHKPQTPMQWLIALADRVSSGFDRNEFENYNHEIGVKDFKKTRLFAIFESLSPDEVPKGDNSEEYFFRYPLRELSPESIFPVKRDDYQLLDSNEQTKEYSDLFFNFVVSLEKLSHKNNIPLWFEHFDSLFMIYASYIPSATVGRIIPDSSLYDHSKMTAALASALYLYHSGTDTLNTEKIKAYQDKKFLIVNGNFYGIQNFIFSEGGSTGKAAAKLLRGRSFAVSLLSELAADMLCRELGLTPASVILNAAGKFTIIAPNLQETKDKILAVEKEINDWLIRMYHGEASFGFSSNEASCDDFTINRFDELWENLSRISERRKYRKIDIGKHGGAVADYLDQFNNDMNKKLCPFCGRRPSSPDAENDRLLGDEKSACNICRDHIYIGTNLVKARRLAVTTLSADIHGDKLKEPIFGSYQVSLDISGKLTELSRDGTLLKYWDISGSVNGTISKEVTAKFINGYVPKYTDKDETEDMLERLLHGSKSEKKKNELFDDIKDGNPKTLHHIAKMALNRIQNSELETKRKYTGIEALGVMKSDIDNLGLLFACGIKQNNLSKMATLSRQTNHYFSIYLPYVLSIKEEFRDIYTVFAGGDDLFLIGPWNRIIDFASDINQSFREYVCDNSHVSISTGICINKPDEPVRTVSEKAEYAVKKSKANRRDSITIFDEAIKWKEFGELRGIKSVIESWLSKSYINNAMLFRMNHFLNMAKQEKALLAGKRAIDFDEMECLKWKSMFKYNLARNIGKGLKGDEKEKAIREVEKAADWLINYGGAMKIPIWQIIYNQR